MYILFSVYTIIYRHMCGMGPAHPQYAVIRTCTDSLYTCSTHTYNHTTSPRCIIVSCLHWSITFCPWGSSVHTLPSHEQLLLWPQCSGIPSALPPEYAEGRDHFHSVSSHFPSVTSRINHITTVNNIVYMDSKCIYLICQNSGSIQTVFKFVWCYTYIKGFHTGRGGRHPLPPLIWFRKSIILYQLVRLLHFLECLSSHSYIYL